MKNLRRCRIWFPDRREFQAALDGAAREPPTGELIDDEVGVFVAGITRGWNDDRFDARRARGVADVLRERLLPVEDVYFPFALEYVIVELEGFLNVGSTRWLTS
jgi:hypothetical protein